MKPMMKCGHRANATCEGKPSCAICAETEIAETVPNLSGRMARCTCGTVRPSDSGNTLAFFEYKGEGSYSAEEYCRDCSYTNMAHLRFDGVLNDSVNSGQWPIGTPKHAFIEHGPFEFDTFYCGHGGWD